MKRKLLLIVLFSINIVLPCFSQNTIKSTAITIYNQGIGIVNEVRNYDIPKGLSVLNVIDIPSLIEPSSVHIKFNGEVIEQNYQYDLVSMTSLLYKYIDQTITLTNKEKSYSGKLLSINDNNIILQTDSGLEVFPNLTSYQINVPKLPEGLLTRPTLVWKINSNQAGKQNINLSYSTSGITWTAEYVAVLNDKENEISFNSWVSIDNTSGGRFENAILKLIAGDVHLIQNSNREYIAAKQNVGNTLENALSTFTEEPFYDYHIYELTTKTTIANNENKQISLFNADNIKVTKEYWYSDNPLKYTNGKVMSVLKFKNTKENNLGIPLPKGKVRIFKERGGMSEFIGEDEIGHTPKDEEIMLKVGNAFDLVASTTLINSKKISDKIYENEYSISLKNHKDEDVVIKVLRNISGNWEILSSNMPYEKSDAHNFLFNVKVKKSEEVVINYKVRVNWGD